MTDARSKRDRAKAEEGVEQLPGPELPQSKVRKAGGGKTKGAHLRARNEDDQVLKGNNERNDNDDNHNDDDNDFLLFSLLLLLLFHNNVSRSKS